MILFLDPSISGPSGIRTTSQTPSSSAPQLPLFEPDASSPIAEDQSISEQSSPSPRLPQFSEDRPIADRRSTSPRLPLFSEDQNILDQGSPSPPFPLLSLRVDDQEVQAMEEMREQFRWLPDLLLRNRGQGWGTAYRDFADVLLLLRATQDLGMVEKSNNVLSAGEFHATTGTYSITIATFVEVMELGHSAATWGNKLTTYFRIMRISSYCQHRGGGFFQSPEHQTAWESLRRWVENRDVFLPNNWITSRYGNTLMARLVREMYQEAHQSKCITISPSGSCFVEHCVWAFLTR